ncbi:MAG: primosomal protein N', partial [Rhodothermales bacterium]
LESIRDVIGILDEEPSVTPEMMRLADWIADYYVCSLGEVVRAVLPSGSAGGRADMATKVEKHVRFTPAYRHAQASEELKQKLRGGKQMAVVECLSGLRAEGNAEPRQSDLLARAGATASTIKTLLKHGIIEVVEKEVFRSPISGPNRERATAHALHPGQETALARIGMAIDEARFHTFLLHGVTGSGKTEVYINALKQTLDRGKTGIVLVPEIALTPQTVRRFRAHFGDRIAVFHSRMSQGERFDAWRALREGSHDVVIGPRSAILLPLSNIGLIVVDEEHEQSYKQQDPAPRYHARDVAVMRALMNDAVCVLGSATPSLESYQNAHGGKYTLLEMRERVPVNGGDPASLPDVRIIDLRVEGKRREGSISRLLEGAITARLERGEQVILLQNRRGYVPLIECTNCGWAPQ